MWRFGSSVRFSCKLVKRPSRRDNQAAYVSYGAFLIACIITWLFHEWPQAWHRCTYIADFLHFLELSFPFLGSHCLFSMIG
jgi:hypothetical protein